MEDWTLNREAGETEFTHPWKTSKVALQTMKDKVCTRISLNSVVSEQDTQTKCIIQSTHSDVYTCIDLKK